MGFVLRLMGILLLAGALSGCVAAVAGGVAAGAAAGIWAYDQHTEDSGEIVLGFSPERVFAESEYVAKARGEEIEAVPGSMRLNAEVEGSDVRIQVFVIPGNENVSRLKIRARSFFKGEPDLARSLAMDVQDRLNG